METNQLKRKNKKTSKLFSNCFYWVVGWDMNCANCRTPIIRKFAFGVEIQNNLRAVSVRIDEQIVTMCSFHYAFCEWKRHMFVFHHFYIGKVGG